MSNIAVLERKVEEEIPMESQESKGFFSYNVDDLNKRLKADELRLKRYGNVVSALIKLRKDRMNLDLMGDKTRERVLRSYGAKGIEKIKRIQDYVKRNNFKRIMAELLTYGVNRALNKFMGEDIAPGELDCIGVYIGERQS